MNTQPPHQILLRVAAAFGLAGVALGAFGAHSLQPLLEEHGTTAIWKTAADYHFYHALALLALSMAALPQRKLTLTAVSWIAGILIFSGSLYILSLTGERWLGRVTPVGGLLFLVGWLILLLPIRQR